MPSEAGHEGHDQGDRRLFPLGRPVPLNTLGAGGHDHRRQPTDRVPCRLRAQIHEEGRICADPRRRRLGLVMERGRWVGAVV